ncbi:DUF115 domain-containing protein [Geobacillus zalihae]|uniref:motility associated factor glycosyltransferase family protein n=1 Tax=Geobacillus zalihae TaxID=213419 RepID=UPI002627814F|nr:6-hydroxymethylpterin diphosphokinase MptE-like protein [Geobacillus zalihae]WKA47116.1 DUF115 domain-containing protein [Geobacillus zalihae]
MNFLETNIASLARNSKNMISEIKESDLKFLYVNKIGDSEFFVDRNEKIYEIRNEIIEEDKPNKKIRQLYFIIGIYNVDEIKFMIENANKNTFFIIIEPELSFLLAAMQNKDLTFLEKDNVMIVAQPVNQLQAILEKIFTTLIVFLTANVKIYATYYYRTYDLATYKEIVKIISNSIKYKLFTLGNSVEDSLIGLAHNLLNIRYLNGSLDVRELKNKFKNIPAIIVSAGPSLDKNIHHLKNVKGKALIFAVDTILERLLKEGIIPDFVLSIERINEVYEYFYKNKEIPQDITLIAPPVIKPIIFQEYKGKYIIPLRNEVSEYRWLDGILNFGEKAFVTMGSSVAHLAFGMAEHFGASPIILVGQDLAFSEDLNKTHSSGTIYDKNQFTMHEEPKYEIEGYYGNKVLTRKIWLDFKKWFEIQILNRGIKVINATEGGAKIEHTESLPLKEAIETYCTRIIDVQKVLEECPKYTVNINDVIKKLEEEIKNIKKINHQANELNSKLRKISLHDKASTDELLKVLNEMKQVDLLLSAIYKHKLVVHNLQSQIVNSFRKLYSLEEVLSTEVVRQNLNIQLEFTEVVAKITENIIKVIEDCKSQLATK